MLMRETGEASGECGRSAARTVAAIGGTAVDGRVITENYELLDSARRVSGGVARPPVETPASQNDRRGVRPC